MNTRPTFSSKFLPEHFPSEHGEHEGERVDGRHGQRQICNIQLIAALISTAFTSHRNHFILIINLLSYTMTSSQSELSKECGSDLL